MSWKIPKALQAYLPKIFDNKKDATNLAAPGLVDEFPSYSDHIRAAADEIQAFHLSLAAKNLTTPCSGLAPYEANLGAGVSWFPQYVEVSEEVRAAVKQPELFAKRWLSFLALSDVAEVLFSRVKPDWLYVMDKADEKIDVAEMRRASVANNNELRPPQRLTTVPMYADEVEFDAYVMASIFAQVYRIRDHVVGRHNNMLKELRDRCAVAGVSADDCEGDAWISPLMARCDRSRHLVTINFELLITGVFYYGPECDQAWLAEKRLQPYHIRRLPDSFTA